MAVHKLRFVITGTFDANTENYNGDVDVSNADLLAKVIKDDLDTGNYSFDEFLDQDYIEDLTIIVTKDHQ